MRSYVWLTFAFMGWGYYEMSGGTDFVPVERVTAEVEAEAPEIVARADTTTLLSVSSSNIIAQPTSTAVEVAVADAVALDEVEVVEAVAPVVEPVLDIRRVGGSRVNMRMGPGTNFDVITTLNSGTELEVLSVNADGWANVSTVDRGIEGWMAERLLTDADL
ncbi:SH3 domain-containing protein [Octadecabacter temperatus]|uniref:Bacterial SH3 domain protein n=1 Tax=Octadecabacter temperatus TaxID=1458307 RepID=A0A0K0Y1J0_9RHOB|nr:SH3 domain-containing protein [Octadecabacter temperatus]AKS44808.1 Bacterial SH3 domain protein [Octadecabacter temperatus]SIO35034.1 SH3 domain-containing protein [Octadecabacter temperatus]